MLDSEKNRELMLIGENAEARGVVGALAMARRVASVGGSVEDLQSWCRLNLPETRSFSAGGSSWDSQYMRPLGMPERDISRYSISRAIAKIANGGGLDGVEREADEELSRRAGNLPRKGQFWLPHEALATRALQGQGVATASLGGNIKATELLASEYITALRNRMVIGRLGARMLTGLQGDIAISRTYHNTVAYWVTEVATTTISDLGIQQLTLTPKGVTAKTVYSKQLLVQGNPSIDQLLRDDMIGTIALAIDKAALHGAGSGGEPTGIYSGAAAANLVTLATDGANFNTLGLTAVAALVSLESVLGASNADAGSLAFVTNSKVRGALRAHPSNTNAAVFVWTNGSEPGVGEVLGYRAYVSNQVASDRTVGGHTTASSVFFGDWSQVIMATWGSGLDILVDPYSSAALREIAIYATEYVDVGLRHTESFSILLGIEAG